MKMTKGDGTRGQDALVVVEKLGGGGGKLYIVCGLPACLLSHILICLMGVRRNSGKQRGLYALKEEWKKLDSKHKRQKI